MYKSRKILNKYRTKVPYHDHIIHTMIVLIILLLNLFILITLFILGHVLEKNCHSNKKNLFLGSEDL